MNLSVESNTHYSDEDMLQLSGIQHYVFCPRQWALMHLEQIWADNLLTAEGSLYHQNVDNPNLREINGSNIITLRGLRLASTRLGFSGIADAVDIIPYSNAPYKKEDILKSKLFDVLPIEYKHGKPKTSDCDRLQVGVQAIILEEMLSVNITQGAIFYWSVRHREYFDITDNMRNRIVEIAKEMHIIAKKGCLPPAIKKPHCKNCSLLDYCLPSLTGRSARKYLQESEKYLNSDI